MVHNLQMFPISLNFSPAVHNPTRFFMSPLQVYLSQGLPTCLSSLISSLMVIIFSVTSLIKFIPKYFCLFVFDVIVIGIFCFFFRYFLFVCKNITNISMFTLYPTTLHSLSVLIDFWWSLGYSVYKIIFSANNDSFNSYF